MKYLFVHQNFPGQFLHPIRHLLGRKGNEIAFITEPNKNHIPGVRRLNYQVTPPPQDTTHPHIRDLNLAGDPAQRVAQGGYVLAEHAFTPEDREARVVRGFLRAGIADGDTTPFRGGWQAGLLVEKVFASRPDSAFSVGIEQGYLSAKARANAISVATPKMTVIALPTRVMPMSRRSMTLSRSRTTGSVASAW